jgi:hypothetical protein
MTARRSNVDQQPKSEFCKQAEDLLARRLAARTTGDRRALEAELTVLLATHRLRNAWDAVRDAEAVEQPAGVPRDTTRDRNCHSSAPAVDVVDRKVAAAGPDVE